MAEVSPTSTMQHAIQSQQSNRLFKACVFSRFQFLIKQFQTLLPTQDACKFLEQSVLDNIISASVMLHCCGFRHLVLEILSNCACECLAAAISRCFVHRKTAISSCTTVAS
eukprot:4062473-Amphidinium_carterae.1